jgi:Ca2+-binding EF-hand superfamily protein
LTYSEFQQATKELGYTITDEEREEVMKDLDMNGDGFVDIHEFTRWYLTGMKSYSDAERNIMKTK